MLDTLPTKYAFKIGNLRISAEDQQDLIGRAKALLEAGIVSPQPFSLTHTPSEQPGFWLSIDCRETVTHSTNRSFARRQRLNPAIEWQWMDTDLARRVQEVILPTQNVFSKLARVIVLLQTPGLDLPLHKDYPRGTGSKEVQLANRNFALKIPLTEKLGDNGFPLARIDGQTYSFDVGDNMYALNEMDMYHGGGKCDHYRGVIFMDGIIDWDVVDKMGHWPIPAQPYSGDIEIQL